MTIEEIRKNAPNGAVRYESNGVKVYYFNAHDHVWNGFNWVIDTAWIRTKKVLAKPL